LPSNTEDTRKQRKKYRENLDHCPRKLLLLSQARVKNGPLKFLYVGFPVWSQGERHLFGAVALFKTLNQGKKGRAFLSFGVAAHYNRSIYEDEHGQIHISNGDDESYGLIFGPGVGLERWFAENFAVSLEIPAAIRVDSDEGFSILPIPNCALAYRW
jgi:hypothetical protein